MIEPTCWRRDVPEPGVMVVTLDRPPVNAQDATSRDEFLALMDDLSADDQVRAVVLTGAGHVFSAGADLKERVGMSGGSAAYLEHNRRTREFLHSVTDCRKPVIAALNGAVIGAGFALAAGCDILIAAESAHLRMPELDRGLMGGFAFLDQQLPRSVSRLLFFTGRTLSAAEMLRHGMVADVVPDDQLLPSTIAIAREIANKFPAAVTEAKAVANAVETMPYRDGYRFEQGVTFRLSGSAYAREAQSAFVEKRDPDFGDPG